jgi:hypothetical protein
MLRIAFATSDRQTVDLHFGGAESLLIYDVSPGQSDLVGEATFIKAEETGEIDHVDFRRHLVSNTYKGWISLVQASGPDDQHDARLAAAMTFVRATYFGKPLDDGERVLEGRPPLRAAHY